MARLLTLCAALGLIVMAAAPPALALGPPVPGVPVPGGPAHRGPAHGDPAQGGPAQGGPPGQHGAAPGGPVIGGPRLGRRGIVVSYPARHARRLPAVPAAAYVIADAGTGAVLAAKDPHGHFQPAGTLKILTADALTLVLHADATVVASPLAARVSAGRGGAGGRPPLPGVRPVPGDAAGLGQ